MEVLLDKQPEKYIRKLHEPMKSRMLAVLEKLSREPPEGDILKMSNSSDFRIRVGGYRAIFHIEGDVIIVSKIAPRGQAYKE
jgi:mRNA interferase RelE/StbE